MPRAKKRAEEQPIPVSVAPEELKSQEKDELLIGDIVKIVKPSQMPELETHFGRTSEQREAGLEPKDAEEVTPWTIGQSPKDVGVKYVESLDGSYGVVVPNPFPSVDGSWVSVNIGGQNYDLSTEYLTKV